MLRRLPISPLIPRHRRPDVLQRAKIDISMEVDDLAFPVLIVAADGWVEYAKTALALTVWTAAAVRKYGNSRLLVCDSLERLWMADNIVPSRPRNALLRLSDKIRNPRIAIRITPRQITDDPANTLRNALLAALDEDDDILTQHVGGAELKRHIEGANSFSALVSVLKSAKVIDT